MKKPCPFCDKTNNQPEGHCDFHQSGESGEQKHFFCYNCHAMGPAGRDNDEALRLWNTRKENVSKDGACPFCGSTHFVMRTTSWHQSHGYDRGALVCSDCGASGPVGTVMPPK